MGKPVEKKKYRYEVLYKPGKFLTDERIADLSEKIRKTVLTWYEEVPDYQVMAGTREALMDKIISIAWREDGEIGGFCSAVILPVDGVGDVIHLGLTLNTPDDASQGLTHILSNKVLSKHVLKKFILGKMWISSCAAVLSSLVNVAIYFDAVYPSPREDSKLTETHKKIQHAINTQYRDKLYITEDVEFDYEKSIFIGSVKGTVFHKEEDDKRFHHRNKRYNDFYRDLLDFKRGDEVLQIGYAMPLFAAIKHFTRRFKKKKSR